METTCTIRFTHNPLLITKKRSLDARITMFVNTIFTEYHNHSILKIHFVTSARPLVEILTVCIYGIDALNNYIVPKKINRFIVITLYGVH